jgi:hypothetical protein
MSQRAQSSRSAGTPPRRCELKVPDLSARARSRRALPPSFQTDLAPPPLKRADKKAPTRGQRGRLWRLRRRWRPFSGGCGRNRLAGWQPSRFSHCISCYSNLSLQTRRVCGSSLFNFEVRDASSQTRRQASDGAVQAVALRADAAVEVCASVEERGVSPREHGANFDSEGLAFSGREARSVFEAVEVHKLASGRLT